MNYTGLKLKGFQGSEIEIVSYLEKFNMYQAKETKGNITTSPLLTESELNKLIQAQSKINQCKQEVKQLQEQKGQEEKEIEELESIGNFKKHDPKLHAKAKTALNKEFKYNGQWYSRKSYVNEILNDNNIEPFNYKGKWYFKNLKQDTILQATKTEIEYYIYLKANYHNDSIITEDIKQQLIKQYMEILAA
jgi:hypothetical protein